MEVKKALELATSLASRVAENTKEFESANFCFTGIGTYLYEDMVSLIPHIECFNLNNFIPDGLETFTHTRFFVVGDYDFSENQIREYVEVHQDDAAFIPQEGFLDLVLFGCNWWDDENYHYMLDHFLERNEGLQFAKSLETTSFRWPSTNAPTGIGEGGLDINPPEQGDLSKNGYALTDTNGNYRTSPDRQRRLQKILAHPRTMTLKEVADKIATFCRNMKRRAAKSPGGNYPSIEMWESDLAWLKDNYYDNPNEFRWPNT